MIVQLAKQRIHRLFKAYEVAEDGSIINRSRTLVVRIPKNAIGVALIGSVWKLSDKPKINRYKVNGFTIEEDFIDARNPQFLQPSGELLARWIAANIERVGEVKAKRLVRAIPDLDEVARSGDWHRISSVSGINIDTAKKIIELWPSQALYQAIRWLQESQLPIGLADRLTRVYGDEVIYKLTTDPFVLMSLGVSFETVLQIIENLNLTISDERKYAAIAERVTHSHCVDTGSTVISEEALIKGSEQHCKDLKLKVDGICKAAVSTGTLLPVETGYQALGYAIQEAAVAKFLSKCHNRPSGAGSLLASWEKCVTKETIEQSISDFEKTLPFQMTFEQRSAVSGVLESPVAVISGGAGTGKTTILLAVLSVYESLSSGMAVMQVALSGRAALRMAEATGREAMTIAKLIANYAGDNKPDMPAHCLLVVDEASMVDLLSAYRLIGLLPYATRIILVGDVAQLPPVGAGLVFHSAMLSNLPVFELTQVKRQGQDSGIHKLATAIRHSNYDDSLLISPVGDVFYSADASETSIIDAYFGAGGPDNAIVLTPTRKGPLGVKAINRLIQSSFDDDQPLTLHYQDPAYGWISWVTASDCQLRLGDQVMVTANDYDEDIRNGDLGMITDVYSESQDGAYGVVCIGGRDIQINQALLDKLDLGYAITIHKSQGSQWPSCLLLLPAYAKQMLDQTLLYTAVTRASKNLIVMGDKSLIDRAVERGSSVYERTTNLLSRLTT